MKQVVDKLTLFIVLCLAVGSFQAAAQSTYTLTANGIGPVQIGVKAIELPESVPNLYDSKVSDVYIDEEMPDDEDMPEFATWYFYDEDGEVVFTATQDSEGYISEINISSPKFLTPEGIHVGTPQQQLDKIKGAMRIDPDPMADETYARLSYVLNGITYWIDGFYIDDDHSEDRIASITISDPVLTAEGIGPVRIGTKASDLPESSPRLYASRILGNGKTTPKGNPTDWHFLDDNGNELFTAEQDDEGQISQITITTPSITTFLGVHPGMSLQQVEELRGEPLEKPLSNDAYNSYDLYDIALNVNKAPKNLDKNKQLIASMSVPGVAYERLNYVINQVMPYYSSCTSLQQLESHLDEIRNIDGVKSAYSDGNTSLYVDIFGSPSVSFDYFPLDLSNDHLTLPEYKELIKRIQAGSKDFLNTNTKERFSYNTFTVANQLENDVVDANNIKWITDMAIDMFKYAGFNNVKYSSPTVDFFLNGIFDNDMVFLITQGSYDKEMDIHWLLTSSVAGTYNNNRKCYILSRAYTKYKDYLKSAYVAFSFCTEKRWYGDEKLIYFKVSDQFILASQKSFLNRGHAIVFNTACQSMGGENGPNDGLAKAFFNKGARAYLGYDNNVKKGVAICGGLQFFSRLISGMSIKDAYGSLDKQSKEDSSNKAKLQLFSNQNTNYMFPRKIKGDFKLPMRKRVENNNLVEEQWIEFSTTYTMPIVYYDVINASKYELTINEDLKAIPLEYGFKLCKNEYFKENETLTLKVDLNESSSVLSKDKTVELVRVSSEVGENPMVTLRLSFKMPLKDCPFWDPRHECFWIKPIVYNKNSGYASVSTKTHFSKHAL